MAFSIDTTTYDQEGANDAMAMSSSAAASRSDASRRLAQSLGWFSVGLGLAQLLVPNDVARLTGAQPTTDTRRLMRLLGLREVSAGLGILSGRRTAAWMRARVAGDVMDLALLTRLLANDSNRQGATAAAALAVAGVTALDALAAKQLSRGRRVAARLPEEPAMDDEKELATRTIRRAITINRSPAEVAAFWRANAHDDDALSECVRFVPAPGGRGTEVHLERTYEKPGRIAAIIAKVRHDDPAQYAFDELLALKQVLETGDIVISDAWINGPHRPHPAQPE